VLDAFEHRILLVMADADNRETYALLLASDGYDISTAEDGFSGLLLLGEECPDVLVCDVNMQHMSGSAFLSAVRHRLPQVLVIAMGEASSSEVTADAFCAKGEKEPEALLGTIAHLIRTSGAKASADTKSPSPVEIPCNRKDSRATPYIVATCTKCLQSFSLDLTERAPAQVLETSCIFCRNKIRYVIDSSFSVGLLLNAERTWREPEARNPAGQED
jgi:CheY-like chemotaxis protein